MIEKYYIKHNVTGGTNSLMFFPDYKNSKGEFDSLLGLKAMGKGLCQSPKESPGWKFDPERGCMFMSLEESPVPSPEILVAYCAAAQAAVTEMMDEIIRWQTISSASGGFHYGR